MGDTFTNLQVLPGKPNAASGRVKLARRIRAHLGRLGFTRCGPGRGDRDILIGPVQSGSWIAVYDSALALSDVRLLDTLGSALSANGFGTAVGVAVHDSDLLEMKLYCNGAVGGRFSNWPGYFNGDPKPLSPEIDHPEAWLNLVNDSRDSSALEVAWRSSPLESAEDVLVRISRLIGWEPDAVLCGLTRLTETQKSACLQLGFRTVPATVSTRPELRLPSLAHVGGTGPQIRAREGETVALSIVAHNVGAAGRGLTGVVWGTAVDRGLLDLKDVRVVLGPPREGIKLFAPLQVAQSSTGPIRVAAFPDAELRSGPATAAAAFHSGIDFKQGMQSWLTGRIEFSLAGALLAAGRADIHLEVVACRESGGRPGFLDIPPGY